MREYRLSRGAVAYYVAFSVVWAGSFAWLLVRAPGGGPWTFRVGIVAVATLLGLAPALVTAAMPYRITLTANGVARFRSLLREQRVHAADVTSIRWDDEELVIRHRGGKVKILADRGFRPFVVDLLRTNPQIAADDNVRESVVSDGG